MNPFVLYLVLLKATLTSFSGMTSLPIVRDELVLKRQVLTDRQLNEALVIGRATPGPKGLYVISVGYFAAGWQGAAAAWAAVATPALTVIPLYLFLHRRTNDPRIRSLLRSVLLAAAGLSLATVAPLARDAITTPLALGVCVVCLWLVVKTEWDSLMIMAGAAAVTWAAYVIR